MTANPHEERGGLRMLTVHLAEYGALLVTRERGKAVAGHLPSGDLALDFDGVDVASSSFLDELLVKIHDRGNRTAVENATPAIMANIARIERVRGFRVAELA